MAGSTNAGSILTLFLSFFFNKASVCTDTRARANLRTTVRRVAGNFYSIENRAQKLARIFFAQACEVILEPEDDE
jgi:hypothetical protein